MRVGRLRNLVDSQNHKLDIPYEEEEAFKDVIDALVNGQPTLYIAM